MLNLKQQIAHLFSQGGYVGDPTGNPINSPWFNHAAGIAANVRSVFAAPNPVVTAQYLPRPVSIVQNTYGNLPPASQEPLGTNTRI